VSVAEGNRLVISTFEQRDSFAELRLLRDVFLAAIGADETKIEASFCEAIRIAKGAGVGFAREKRRSKLRRISQAKSERARRTWIPTSVMRG
jgi:hypothetical protein